MIQHTLRPRGTKVKSWIVFIFVLMVFIISPGINSQSAQISPGYKNAHAPTVSPKDAWEILQKRVPFPVKILARVGSATESTPEIQELARGLKNDPELIYLFVLNHIDYLPIYGSVKGAAMTLLDRKGNDFDQTSLFIALMREAGYTANYVYGQIRLTPAEISNWLGSGTDPDVVSMLLGSAGIPATIWTYPSGELAQVDLDHVWAKATIDSTDYVFDVSYKPYTYTAGIDLATALQYNQTTFINHALQGATVDPDYVQNINTANIRNDLSTYSMNLVDYITTNMFDAGLSDVIGGREIVKTDSMTLQTTLPYQLAVYAEWTDIPAGYCTTLRIQHLGIDETFDSAEIYGKRLTIFYNVSDQPELRLDGTLVATGSAVTPGTYNDITLSVDHPYAYLSGTYGDETFTTQIKAGGSYFVVNNWFGSARNIIEKHRKQLKQNEDAGGADSSEPVLGESLAMIAFSWLSETFQADHIIDRIANTITIHHHTIGFAGQNESPYVDIPLSFVSVISKDNSQEKEDAAFAVQAGIGSAFEWGVIEQLQPFGAVSTVKLMNISNNNSDKIFDADNSTYWSLVKPQLVNYSAYEYAQVEAYINAGCRLTLPQDGDLNEGDWYGIGFISWCDDGTGGSRIGHIIGGGLKGGYGTEQWSLWNYFQNVYDGLLSAVPVSERDTMQDPVDAISGDYYYSHDDLSVGSGKFPFRLTFSRLYNSAGRLEDGPLGCGWTHNFDVSATRGSDGFQGLGADSPIDAAPAIAEIYTALDLFSSSMSNDCTVVVTLSHKWFMDQLIDKVVTVTIARDTYQFVELPDGSFNPPPTSADILSVEPDSTFLLSRKYGISLDFGIDGKIATWSDPHNTVQFQYAGDKLDRVSNAFTRYLQFAYLGDRISSVIDSSGRSISYGYDGLGTLTTFTNAESKVSTFAYDSSKRLEKIFYPKDQINPFVLNAYDSLDRVKQQTNARGYTYSFYYSYYRTEEEDPLGYSHIRFFDDLHHLTAEEDALVNKTVYAYDNRGRRVSVTYSRSNAVVYEYDNRHNITKITLVPVQCSSEPNIVEKFVYEPVFSFLDTYTDPRDYETKYYYDGSGNMYRVEQPEVDGEIPTTRFTYNVYGQVETITDPEDVETRYEYDPATSDLLKVIVDNGTNLDDLNITTRMDYDSVGNIWHRTNPRGYTTTFEYDNLRQLTKITAPAPFSYVTEYEYDDNRNLQKISRQADNASTQWQTIKYTYTPTNELETVTDNMSQVTSYEYDQTDRLWKITDANTHTTQRLYYDNGQLRNIIDAKGDNATEYGYTENGRLAWLKDGKGNTTTYEYDDHDRLRKTIYPDASLYEEFTYDNASNITQKRLRDGRTISYSYDPLNRLDTKILPDPKMITYEYDLVSRLTDITDPLGTIHHVYDDAGRVTSVSYPDGKTVGYQYDDAGNRVRLTYPDTSYITYEYDGLNRLTHIYDQGTTQLAHYSYDPLLRRITMGYANGTGTSYSYDRANNLLELQHQFNGTSLDFSYSYDPVGNRISTGVSDDNCVYNPLAESMSYTSNELNQYTSVGGISYVYNTNGNLTSDGTNTYTYDAENQLLTANTSSYGYDPLGRRISKNVDSTTTKYLYDDIHSICEYDGSDQLLRKYVYGPGIDQPVCMISGGQTYYYHFDGLGSVIGLTNSSGSLVESYSYDVYGNITTPLSSVGNQYYFTGQGYDSETGLYLYKLRYYSPELGSFLQTDLFGYNTGINLYDYVNNNPTNFIDPLGFCKEYLNIAGIEHTLENLFLGKRQTLVAPYEKTGSITLGVLKAAREAVVPFYTPVTKSARDQIFYELGYQRGAKIPLVEVHSGGAYIPPKLLASGDIGSINTLKIYGNNLLVPGRRIFRSLGVKNVIYNARLPEISDPHTILSHSPGYDLYTQDRWGYNETIVTIEWRYSF